MRAVVIELPGASQFDAEAFGLWLGTIIHDRQSDDPGATPVGAIKVKVME